MIYYLVLGIIITALLYHYYAIYQQKKLVKYILKPGTMGLIISLAVLGSSLETSFSKWVVIALLFSVAGDIFLMLSDRWFMHGLISFFIAHLVYIAGLLEGFSLEFSLFYGGGSGLIVGLVAVTFFFMLVSSVRQQGGTKLVIAVAFYIIVISLMVWFAMLTKSPLLIIAASLFLISDAILAYDKFKKSFTSAEHLVMATYYSAQFLFAFSLL